MNLAEAYLSYPVAAHEMLATPTDADVHKLGRAMDAFHNKCKVAHRFQGHEGSRPVSPRRLRNLLMGESAIALIVIRTAVEAVQVAGESPFEKPWGISLQNTVFIDSARQQLASEVDSIFTDPRFERTASIMKRVGMVLSRIKSSDEMKNLAAEYQKALRNRNVNASARDRMLESGVRTQEVTKGLRALFSMGFEKEFPESDYPGLAARLTDAFIWDQNPKYKNIR
jgi:hypothetical protein